MPKALSNVSGFPRIGPQRELKMATEAYWADQRPLDQLLETASGLRADNWKLQREAGIDLIPSNDFSLYDQMLDMIALVGAVPERYGWDASSATWTATPTSRWRAAARTVGWTSPRWR